MVLHTLYVLIVLVALAGNEDDIALLGKHTGRADGLTTVNDGNHAGLLRRSEPGKHVIDDVLRLLETGVVAGDDDLVAALHGLLSHDGALALVAVATGTYHGDDLALATLHLVNGTQHIGYGIGSVGIVDNGGEALRGVYGIEASAHGAQRAEHGEHLLGALAQEAGCAIYGKEVAGVELTDELHEELHAVDVEHHAVEVVLKDTALEVGQATERVGIHLGTRVLRHHQSVLVVEVGHHESILGQGIEEGLLGTQVVVHGLVIVHMVAREVGKDTSCKLKSTDTALRHGV